MREEQHPAARPPDADRELPRSGQDWAASLRDAHHPRPPGQPPPTPDGIEAAWTALTHLARREGFTVHRADCAGADGFTTWRNRTIRISPDTPPAQAVVALAHQLGHVLLHSQIARLEHAATIPCTGIRKVEADSVAYLAATSIGFDATTIVFPHVTSWAGTDPRARPAATIHAVTTRILTAAAAITARFDAADLAHEQLPAPACGDTNQHAGPPIAASDHARIHQNAAQFFRSQMPGSWVPEYLSRRGLTAAVQDTWQAGYAPAEWDALTRHLRAAGYSETLIEAAGLARRSRRGTLIDTFRDRAMLPIRAADGTMVAFIGRAGEHADPGTPKYLNSPATSHYSKSEILFGLSEARAALTRGARPVVVEGPLDAIAVTTAGHGSHIGVAPCGTALTADHAAALARVADLRATGVTVAFDPDQAGRRAAARAYHLLVPHTEELATATFPAGQDPAQILTDSGPTALAEMLSSRIRPLPDLVVNTEVARWSRWLRHPEGQIHALRATAPLIAAMPPAHIGRQVARLAAVLKLANAAVTEAVTDALTTLISAQPDDTSPNAKTHQAELRGPPSAAIQAVHDGYPRGGRQEVNAETERPPIPAASRPAGADRRLTGRKIRS